MYLLFFGFCGFIYSWRFAEILINILKKTMERSRAEKMYLLYLAKKYLLNWFYRQTMIINILCMFDPI